MHDGDVGEGGHGLVAAALYYDFGVGVLLNIQPGDGFLKQRLFEVFERAEHVAVGVILQFDGQQHVGPGGHDGIGGADDGHVLAGILGPVVGFDEFAEILFAQHEAVKKVVLDVVHHPLAGVDEVFEVEGDEAAVGDAIDEKGFLGFHKKTA